ncbi:MAG TPA: hypothetical protein VGE01_01595 [Fimbriimonas sp.]
MPDRPPFDVAPFALPNTPPGELRFEEPREVVRLIAYYAEGAPTTARCEYMQKYWPESALPPQDPLSEPSRYGWIPEDDLFMSAWREGKADVRKIGDRTLEIAFRDAGEEYPVAQGLAFRRTLGVRVEPPPTSLEVETTGEPTTTQVIVEGTERLSVEAYNARVLNRERIEGGWRLAVHHLVPRHPDSNDDAHLTLETDQGRFTVPVGEPVLHQGVYIRPEGGLSREEYEARHLDARTVMARVLERPESSLGRATLGQPRAHRVGTNLGWPYSRLRYKIEPNADLHLPRSNVDFPDLGNTARFKAKGSPRFYFHLEEWLPLGMWPDPAPVLSINHRFRKGDVECEARSVCVPLLRSPFSGELEGEETTVALMRFRFRNVGTKRVEARFRLAYSQDSRRDENAYSDQPSNEWHVPDSDLDTLKLEAGRLESEGVLRAWVSSTMNGRSGGKQVRWSEELEPGGTCELVLKVPFLEPSARELEALERLDFERADRDSTRFWQQFGEQGAQLQTPVAQLNELHRAHAAHVAVTDFLMPGGEGLINTSVGTSTYGNFSNESVMIVRELDGRGLHDEARRRLNLWIKYQGTAEQPGNFTDYDGMFFGAGGFEQGAYNQHHGWVLWGLCEHFWHTRDRQWLDRAMPAILKGAEWIFRQRRNTLGRLPHSRGWEKGFMPAGSLEDVTDYHYWLVVNAVMWRAADATASLAESVGHAESSRLRREADAYRVDLLQGFQTSRERSPLVKLRDGRWVPHDPSRLYRRGRDVGWIRETLEGSMYLLISGLLDPRSPQADAILEDYHDNRFVRPPFGYVIRDWASEWFDHGGISIQPNLLATPDVHLARDEPELFLWTFFNSWASCYREEINAMVEHPMPILGYSNNAHFKTSDQANAIRWLRSMLVYASPEVLHFGRAMPRNWFGKEARLDDASTRFGRCSIAYRAEGDAVTARIGLRLHEAPPKVLVRFRSDAALRSASLDGRPIPLVGADVELPPRSGEYVVRAERAS